MDDPIDRSAWKLDEQIQSVLDKIKGHHQYAWLEGKLLALSAKLTTHHFKYRDAMLRGRNSVAAREAEAIGACEKEYKKLLRPPGALDIDITYG